MKTLQLIAGMILISTMLQAQAQWQLSGNTSTFPATDFLGTTDARDLSFRTDNTIRMQLESTGELGIGTTSPSSWLHVLSRTEGAVAATEVFRTAVPTATETNWRMLKGTITVMRLWVPGNSDAVFMQSPRGDFKIL